MAKFIFVTGGVVSGLGKGITAASLGRLLKARGFKVAAQKLDPYINVDPGTMSPYQHGEVFVTNDGAETDLDHQIKNVTAREQQGTAGPQEAGMIAIPDELRDREQVAVIDTPADKIQEPRADEPRDNCHGDH